MKNPKYKPHVCVHGISTDDSCGLCMRATFKSLDQQAEEATGTALLRRDSDKPVKNYIAYLREENMKLEHTIRKLRTKLKEATK